MSQNHPGLKPLKNYDIWIISLSAYYKRLQIFFGYKIKTKPLYYRILMGLINTVEYISI